jgi:tetratricopeptide (TPR) repeat protein
MRGVIPFVMLSVCVLGAEAARAQQGPPAPPPSPAPPSRGIPMNRLLDQKKAEIDGLLNSLKTATSDEAAAALEQRIKQKWIEAGSPAATLLMSRGLRNLQSQSGDEALDDFDAVLALEPQLQAAYTFRARAKYLVGDYAGAIQDTEAALQREPRNFVALQGLSHIAESRGDLKGALLAWQKVLEIDPRTPDADKRLRELSRKVNGETT